jgi:hypothetical protein
MSLRKLSSKIVETTYTIKLVACVISSRTRQEWAVGRIMQPPKHDVLPSEAVYLVVHITTAGDYYRELRVRTPHTAMLRAVTDARWILPLNASSSSCESTTRGYDLLLNYHYPPTLLIEKLQSNC